MWTAQSGLLPTVRAWTALSASWHLVLDQQHAQQHAQHHAPHLVHGHVHVGSLKTVTTRMVQGSRMGRDIRRDVRQQRKLVLGVVVAAWTSIRMWIMSSLILTAH